MSLENSESTRVWTVAEAKARLSEVLRLSEEEGPQRIGRRKSYVVVPAETWEAMSAAQASMADREHAARADIPIPDRHDSGREIPFSDEDEY